MHWVAIYFAVGFFIALALSLRVLTSDDLKSKPLCTLLAFMVWAIFWPIVILYRYL
jgi:prolipoprotein diacylglyceryltransferase